MSSPLKPVDLKSDTVTRPTQAMRAAMAAAEVGDDVFGEDPTVNRLQQMAAERTGHEASLFVPSGTMGNLVALLTHCGRGDEAILGSQSHIYQHEVAGIAALGGILPRVVPNQADGTLRWEDIEAAIQGGGPYSARTKLVCLENTQGDCGGVPITAEYTARIAEQVHARGLKLHLDGARLFNAATVLATSARDLASAADSVSLCLSKGLGAPAGTMLCGSKAFIAEAVRYRKQLGGAMRQVGVLAAAGIVALESMVDRLAEDHENAGLLASGLGELRGLRISPPATNMVYVTLLPELALSAGDLMEALRARGMLVLGQDRVLRLVTHHDVSQQDVRRTVEAFREVLASNA